MNHSERQMSIEASHGCLLPDRKAESQQRAASEQGQDQRKKGAPATFTPVSPSGSSTQSGVPRVHSQKFDANTTQLKSEIAEPENQLLGGPTHHPDRDVGALRHHL